mmetsp:Transcript_4193/g.16674  ORF Transcript_4193/g.16674 Transcript_4193/m.16674 type:complete len:474 (-) Transcript_4193:558-1979(-)
MASVSVRSTSALKPRAPVSRLSAARASSLHAPFVNSSSAPPQLYTSFWNWRPTAFFGPSITLCSSRSLSERKGTATGNRPTNSGIKPNCTKSKGSTSASASSATRRRSSAEACSGSEVSSSFSSASSAASEARTAPSADARPSTSRGEDLLYGESFWFLFSRPSRDEGLFANLARALLSSRRRATTRSRPENAPPQMNRMLDVSTAMKSPRGFLRPPFSGTFTTDPSTIFNKACCTPSPETSRVMETFSDLRVSLSISSMYTMPLCAACKSKSALTKSLCSRDSTSSPTYPACVSVVASADANGTRTKSASVFARSVLPDPVGPQSSTLDFSSRTSFRTEASAGNAPQSASNGDDANRNERALSSRAAPPASSRTLLRSFSLRSRRHAVAAAAAAAADAGSDASSPTGHQSRVPGYSLLGVTSSSSTCAPRKWLSNTTSELCDARGPRGGTESDAVPEREENPPNLAAARTRA